MNRLTGRTEAGSHSVVYGEEFIFRMNDKDYSLYVKTIDRLADYEDTGLTPEEIKALRKDNEKLHKLMDEIEETVLHEKVSK